MNEYRSGDTNAVVLAGMCTALAVVLSVIGFYMPLVSSVVFLLIPLPIAYLGMKEGVHWSVIVTAGVMILDSVFFGIISAAFLCAIFGVLGIVMGICYKNKISASVTLIAGAVVVLAAIIGEALAAMYILDVPAVIFGGTAMDQMEQEMMDQMSGFYTGELLVQAQDNVKQMMDVIRKSLPFATVGASFFYAWASMTLGKMIFGRMGIKDIPVLPKLERWEFPRFFVVLYAVSVAMQFFLKDNPTFSVIQYNIGLACIFVFWLQGVATLWWLPHKYPLVRPIRWIVIVLSAFMGFIQMFLVLMGLTDMVLSYRRKRNYE